MSQPMRRREPPVMLRGLSGCRPLNRPIRSVPLAVIILLALGCPRWLPWLGSADEHAAEAAVAVEMATDPPPEQIFPDTRPVQLTFKASVDGKPLDSGRLAVQVSAPPRPVLLSTPFPAVEGTILFRLASELRDGTFAADYRFPIRGVYTFDFGLAPGPDAQALRPTTIRHSLDVPADPATVRRGWMFRIVLFSLGGVTGVWYARTTRARKTPPSIAVTATGALMLGSLVVVTSTVTFADHGPRELVFPKGTQVIQGDDGWALEVRPTPEQAAVGELLDLTVMLRREGQVFSGVMDVAMHVYNLKDDQTVLRTKVVALHGSTSQRFQLVESVPHTCTITVHPVGGASDKPVMLTAVVGIDVVAAPTPITVKLRVMGLILGVVGAGVAGGFLLTSGVHKLPGRVER
jgi:hypothetical protein